MTFRMLFIIPYLGVDRRADQPLLADLRKRGTIIMDTNRGCAKKALLHDKDIGK